MTAPEGRLVRTERWERLVERNTAAVGRADSGTGRIRPSLDGGTPALERELGRQGRETVRKLLEAAAAEFDEKGFLTVRVDDVDFEVTRSPTRERDLFSVGRP